MPDQWTVSFLVDGDSVWWPVCQLPVAFAVGDVVHVGGPLGIPRWLVVRRRVINIPKRTVLLLCEETSEP